MRLHLAPVILIAVAAGCSGTDSADTMMDTTGPDVVQDVPTEMPGEITVDPGAIDPGPMDPGTTDLVILDLGSVDPGSTDLVILDFGSVDLGSTDLVILDPGSYDPGSTDPGTQDPGSVDPGGQDTCAEEVCDGIDNDCDGATDEDFEDLDQDGIANCVDPDIDGDGILNEMDGCPYVASANRVDTDQDGQGDECDCDIDNDGVPNVNPGCKNPVPEDNCTFVVNPGQEDTCQDGVGDVCDDDIDCDDIPNDQDNCPLVYNPDQTDTCQMGIGDACHDDNDCDGIGEAEDNCPLDTNPGQEDNDQDGMGDACDEDDDNDLDPDTTDCEPFNPEVHGAAEEVCNAIDDDCDDLTDEDGVCCEPDCTDLECGGDGCGGSCGDCASWEACDQDQLCAKLPTDVAFRLPAAPESLQGDWVVFIDHEPGSDPSDTLGYQCIAYDGSEDFPKCYDEHDGTDFMITGFDLQEALSGFASAFAAMDLGEDVLAAADGQVIAVVDGNYDRCHLDIIAQGISCDGYAMASNHVTLLHSSGHTSSYHHMRNGSIVVGVGDQVLCGEKLGQIGSSGYSTSPHIHFEVRDSMNQVVDPFAGINTQTESYWVDQVWDQLLPAPVCEGN